VDSKLRQTFQQCRDVIWDVFEGWIARYRQEDGFRKIYALLKRRSIGELAGLVRSYLLTGVPIAIQKSNTQRYFNLRDVGEPSYIIDTVVLEHRLANHYANIQD
jgi:hypothetical protein